MMRLMIILFLVIMSFSNEAIAAGVAGAPFTFTGSVIRAGSGCPYAANTALAGYALIHRRSRYVDGGYKSLVSAPQLMVSPPTVGAQKEALQLSDLPLENTTFSGPLTVMPLPSAVTFSGTFKETMKINSNGTYDIKLTVIYKTDVSSCNFVYELLFKRGVPKNILDLL